MTTVPSAKAMGTALPTCISGCCGPKLMLRVGATPAMDTAITSRTPNLVTNEDCGGPFLTALETNRKTYLRGLFAVSF